MSSNIVDPDRSVRRKAVRKKLGGSVRSLDPADPRSLDHPCHREQVLELARAIGRALADEAHEAELKEKAKLLDRIQVTRAARQ
jgi:hypothetical protein